MDISQIRCQHTKDKEIFDSKQRKRMPDYLRMMRSSQKTRVRIVKALNRTDVHPCSIVYGAAPVCRHES